MSSFDVGFSHAYPHAHGLTEELLEGRRVLIDYGETLSRNASEPSNIVFPSETKPPFVYYSIPEDARDLSSYVRLLRDERLASLTGQTLGRQLQAVETTFNGLPSDKVLDRFSTYSDSASGGLGMSIRLLAPYIHLDRSFPYCLNILRREVANTPVDSEVASGFMAGVEQGYEHVG